MSDGQLAWKAAKLAAAVLFWLFAVGTFFFGLTIGVATLFGGWGVALLYAGLIFFIFWIAAAIDLNRKEERDALATEARRAETTGSACEGAAPKGNAQ